MDARRILNQIQPGPDDEVVCAAGEEDEQLGFRGPSMGPEELLSLRIPFRLIRRFVITQASGKKRCIDDAHLGFQSEFSSDGNRLQFCSAIQPCLHVQALAKAFALRGVDLESWPDSISTFGEDLPHAYRKIPVRCDHSWACIVAHYDPHSKQPRFRRYHGILFGLPLAVSAFNRLPFFMQALARRLLALPLSCDFDDVTCQDFASLAHRSQEQVEELFRMFGYLFAEAKRQQPQTSGDFLGLRHDLSQMQTNGHIKDWVRQRLVDKVQDMIDNARATGLLRPGTASKLFGWHGFLDYGAFGRIARAGLNPLKNRQYAKSESRLTAVLTMAFDTIEAVLALHPSREVPVLPLNRLRVVAASGAAQEGYREGSDGLWIVSPDGQRVGTVAHIDEEVFCLWDQGETMIAQLELLMILQGLLCFPSTFLNSTGTWFVDNVASLMALIKSS